MQDRERRLSSTFWIAHARSVRGQKMTFHFEVLNVKCPILSSMVCRGWKSTLIVTSQAVPRHAVKFKWFRIHAGTLGQSVFIHRHKPYKP
eukprot:6372144-Amphidinium_carterae.2